jgi:hypothetical protein
MAGYGGSEGREVGVEMLALALLVEKKKKKISPLAEEREGGGRR